MATLYISEYTNIGLTNGVNIPVPQEPPIAEQTVAITGTSAQSAAFNSATKYIQVHTDAICSVLCGSNPVATTSKKRLPADVTKEFGVNPGDKIAVISNT